jgi:two-component system cell cycle sensor histidine kinase/response regulator CckA
MTVLIVDDVPANLKLLRAILEAEGITVVEATDGRQGLAVLERDKIDLVISDVLMPNMDGYRFCCEVRRSARHCATPFILYTSTYTSDSDEKTGLEMGADRFIRKPALAKVIIAAAYDVLQTKRRRPAPADSDSELYLMKEYSERLVAKLEEKNIELADNFANSRELEARKTAILQSSLDAIVTLDGRGRIIEFNSAAEQMFGYSQGSIIGHDLADFLPAEILISLKSNESLQEAGARSLPHPHTLGERQGRSEGPKPPATGDDTVVAKLSEMTALRADGREFPIEFSIVRIPVEGTTLYTCFIRDITARKQAEEQRRLQATALETTANAILITDRKGAILWVNAAFTNLTGYSGGEVLGKTPRVLKSGAHDQAFYRGLWETITAGETWRGEFTNRRKDGTIFYDEHTITPVRDAGGKITHYIGILHDVTERKRAEAELAGERTLQRTLVDLLPDAIFVKDRESRFILANTACATKMRVVSSQDLIGKTDANFYSAKDAADWRAEELRILNGELVVNEDEVVVLPDGTEQVFAITKVPFRDVNGNIIGLVGSGRNITERKHAEEALARQAVRYKTFMDLSIDSFHVLDQKGDLLEANPAFYRRLGYAAAEMKGMNVADWDGRWTREEMHERMRAMVDLGDTFVTRHRRKNGTTFDVEVSVTSIRIEGQPVLFCVARDITERQRAEKAVRESEARFRQLAENIQEVFWMTNADQSEIIYASPAYEQIWGRTVAGLYQNPQDWIDAIVAEDRPAVIKAFAGLAGGAPEANAEYRICTPEGEIRWILDRGFPIHDETGQLYRIGGVSADITERKLRELLQRVQHEVAVVLVKAAPFQETVNKVLEIICKGLGWDIGELWAVDRLAKLLRCVEIWHPQSTEFKEFVYATRQMTLASGVGLPGRVWKSGQQLWVADASQESTCARQNFAAKLGLRGFLGFPVQVRGDVHGVIGFFSAKIRQPTAELSAMFETISSQLGQFVERRLLEDQLRHSQKMEAIGQLAGGVAHDFNNLLTVIQGHGELLLGQNNLDGQTLEQLNQMFVAAQRAANLTRQLLTFSRKQVMQVKVLNLNEVIGDLTKMLRRVIGEDIALQTSLASKLPSLRADAGMLEQVIMNLCVNARDAMPHGGRLTIGTEPAVVGEQEVQQMPQARRGEFVCLRVHDTGCGMSPEIVAHIFEPFFTTKVAGKGTGLGLATVYGIVKQHEGWIEVSSKVGQGTEFKVFLPAVSTPASEAKRAADQSSMRGGTETILLVEDELAVRELARIVLERLGYRVLEAGSGVDALSVWEAHRSEIALLLTDMVMPDQMTGLELAEKLQAEQPELKVIFTSGYSTDLVGRDLKLLEGKNFLQKPYPPRKLAQAVRECLDTKAQA